MTISGANSLTIKDVKITSDGSIINATSNDAKIILDNAYALPSSIQMEIKLKPDNLQQILLDWL